MTVYRLLVMGRRSNVVFMDTEDGGCNGRAGISAGILIVRLWLMAGSELGKLLHWENSMSNSLG